MAALLRHGAARRLGGSMVQRTQAAVAQERRRLVHTDESVRKEVMLEIQQKKEELYDVLSKAEKDFMIVTWWNRRLLQNLSIQVAPRPYDRNWCRMRILTKVSSFVEITGFVTLCGVAAIGSVFLEWPSAEKEKVPQPLLAQPVLASKSSADKM